MTQFETQLQRFDIQRGAPIMRLDHFNIHSARLRGDVRVLASSSASAAPSTSRPTAPDERLTGAWLRASRRVHDIALTAGRGPRLHHVGLFVAEPAGVLRACDQLAAAGHSDAIERGPGPPRRLQRVLRLPARSRRAPHRALRLRLLHGRSRPRAAALVGQRSALPVLLGHRAPDSWYEESSLVLGPDGGPWSPRRRASTSATFAPRSWPEDGPPRRSSPDEGHRRPPQLPQPCGAARTGPEPALVLPQAASSLGDGGDPVVRPRGTELLVFEGEIAAIIGDRARHVDAGGGPAHDRLVRAGQRRRRARHALGRPRLERALEGPGRVHADRPAGPGRARSTRDACELRTRVNGEVVQDDGRRRPDLSLRAAGRRPVALHDARARRRDPDRDAGRRAPCASPATRSRSRSRASGRSATGSSRPTETAGVASARSRRSTRRAGRRDWEQRRPRDARLSERGHRGAAARLDCDADGPARAPRHRSTFLAGLTADAAGPAAARLRVHAALRAAARGRARRRSAAPS